MSSANNISHLNNQNVLRILVIIDETTNDFSRSIIDYARLIPHVGKAEIETASVEIREIYNDANEIIMLALRLSSVVFNTSDVWGVNFCGHRPTDEYAWKFADELDKRNLTVIRERSYINSRNGCAFVLTMDADQFDLITCPIEMIGEMN